MYLSEEVRAMLGIFELTRRLRAKVPDDPSDIDRPRENVSESAGDQTAMASYLMHYFLPLLEKEDLKLDYHKTLDMVLAHNIGDLGKLQLIPSIQKDIDRRQKEIESTAQIFGELPIRDGFNRALFDAYAEYLGQETRESRFVRALNGLETTLYILSRPAHMRAELVGGKGYAIEDYRERIEPFCREFPPLQKFYTRIERVFHGKGYFAPSRVYQNSVMRPDVARNLFISSAPTFDDSAKVDINAENQGLLRLQALKRRPRFGEDPSVTGRHNDTVPEHISSLLLLGRYFLPAMQCDPRQVEKEVISLNETSKMILSHDMSEAIKGDTISPLKTEKDSQQEWDISAEIAVDFAPRAGKFNEEFWRSLETYEAGIAKTPFVGNSWLVRSLDIFEAQLYIFDRDRRGRLSGFKVLPRQEVRKKIGDALALFPILKEHYDALEKKFLEKGLP